MVGCAECVEHRSLRGIELGKRDQIVFVLIVILVLVFNTSFLCIRNYLRKKVREQAILVRVKASDHSGITGLQDSQGSLGVIDFIAVQQQGTALCRQLMKVGERVVVFTKFPTNSSSDSKRQLLIVLLHLDMFTPDVEFAITAAKQQGIPLGLVYVGSKQGLPMILAHVSATIPAAIANMQPFQRLRETVSLVDIRDRPSIIAFARKCQSDFWAAKSSDAHNAHDVHVITPRASDQGGRRIML
jgi:hypothetical protein